MPTKQPGNAASITCRTAFQNDSMSIVPCRRSRGFSTGESMIVFRLASLWISASSLLAFPNYPLILQPKVRLYLRKGKNRTNQKATYSYLDTRLSWSEI